MREDEARAQFEGAQVDGESFTPWLSAQMARHGLTARQLALYSGVARSTISRILLGRGAPRPDVVAELARYFGADPAEVLAQNGLVRLDAPPEARAEAEALVRRLYALPLADRQGILRQINDILAFLERATPAERAAFVERAAPVEPPPSGEVAAEE